MLRYKTIFFFRNILNFSISNSSFCGLSPYRSDSEEEASIHLIIIYIVLHIVLQVFLFSICLN